ncbi:MAG: YfiR family protein [Myxococcota bacterium]
MSHGVTAWLLAACIMLLATGAAPAPQKKKTASEVEVKAAFLVTVAGYVSWPDSAFASKTDPIVIGVIGKDPFGKVLDTLIVKQERHGRSFRILRLRALPEKPTPEQEAAADAAIRSCHVLFVCSSEKKRLDRTLALTRNRPILTVSDLSGFARDGGMIGLRIDRRRKIAFEMNVASARLCAIRVSPDLLNMAERTYTKVKNR